MTDIDVMKKCRAYVRGLDLLVDDTAGLILLNKVICNKLPRQFLTELFIVTKTNYLDFNLVRKVYQEILIRSQSTQGEEIVL